jgi:hypothetical protein
VIRGCGAQESRRSFRTGVPELSVVVLSACVGQSGRVPVDRGRGAQQPRRFLGTRIRKLSLLLLPASVSQRNVVDSSDPGDSGDAGDPAPILNSVRGGRAITERHGEQWSGSDRGCSPPKSTQLTLELPSCLSLPSSNTSPGPPPASPKRRRWTPGRPGACRRGGRRRE